MFRKRHLWTLWVLAALLPAPVLAQQTMDIRATVVRNCRIDALPMMFGTVSLVNPLADATAALFVECTPGTSFTVTLDDGLNFKNGSRRMENPLANGARRFLEYEVYRNAGRTLRWGGTAATGITQVAPTNGKVTLTAYGRVDGRRAAASPYEDTIAVTIAF